MSKIIEGIKRYRELVYYLTLREIKARYKQTLLGCSWALFHPLLMMLIFTVIFSKIARITSEGVPYPIFVFCGILSWNFFSTSLNYATNSLTFNRSLIQKIYFPRAFFPLTSTFCCFFDLFISSILFIFLLMYFEIELSFFALWILPIFFIQFVFTLSVSLLLASFNVFFRDVKNAIVILLQLWFYCTPVIYPFSMIPEKYRLLLLLNPMAVIIDSYRQVLFHGGHPDMFYLAICFCETFFIFIFAYFVFKKLDGVIADYI